MVGAFGVLFGVRASRLVSKLNIWPVLVSTSAIVGSVAFSAIIGIFVGFIPGARRRSSTRSRRSAMSMPPGIIFPH